MFMLAALASQLMLTFFLSPVVMLCAMAVTSVRPNMSDTLARARLASPPPTFTVRRAEEVEASTCSPIMAAGSTLATASVMTYVRGTPG